MKEINIGIYDDKTIKIKNNKIGDKFDNQIYKLVFNFDNCSFFNSMTYKYFLIKNDFKDYEQIELNDDLEFVLNTYYTSQYGTWDCLIVLSNQELDGKLENNKDIWISNIFNLYITNNFLDKDFIIIDNKEGF